MVRLLHILGICVWLGAAGVVGLWLSGRSQHSSQIEEFLNRPGAIQMFRAQAGESGVRQAEISPLVAQAEAYARLVDPPKRPERPSASVLTASASLAAPAVRPAAPSVRFRLCGTSYYPNEPGRSMALISEVGSPEGSERWVKEGTQMGHFVIHEIRKGMIVCRDGEQLREMAVEHGVNVPSLVRDARPGSRQISSAADDAMTTSAGPTGASSVEPVGGN
jgi:hypothetical protein